MNGEKKVICTQDGHIICPECKTRLVPVEIKSFMRCPVCDYRFADTPEMRDLLVWQNILNDFQRQRG